MADAQPLNSVQEMSEEEAMAAAIQASLQDDPEASSRNLLEADPPQAM